MRDSRELQGGHERRREASRGRTRNEAGRVPEPVQAGDDAEERASRALAGEGSATEAAMARACAANSQVEKLANTPQARRQQMRKLEEPRIQQLRKLEEPPERHE